MELMGWVLTSAFSSETDGAVEGRWVTQVWLVRSPGTGTLPIPTSVLEEGGKTEDMGIRESKILYSLPIIRILITS